MFWCADTVQYVYEKRSKSIWCFCQITIDFHFSFSHAVSYFPGISGHSFPEGYRLSFPTRTNYMYAVMNHAIPKLRAFTLCLWLRPAEGGIGTPLSYAVPEQPNELVLLQGLRSPADLLINDKVLYLSALCTVKEYELLLYVCTDPGVIDLSKKMYISVCMWVIRLVMCGFNCWNVVIT